MSKCFKIIFPILLTMVVFTVACQSENTVLQSNPSNNSSANTLIVRPKSGINSKVCGAMYEFKYNGESIKPFILSQPMPEMWIVEAKKDDESEIDCNGERINLTEESKNLLQQHWQDRLEYEFLNEFEGTEKGKEAYDRDIKLSKSALNLTQNLLNTPISDDKSARNITSEEADEFVVFIRDNSYKVSEAIKKAKVKN